MIRNCNLFFFRLTKTELIKVEHLEYSNPFTKSMYIVPL